MKNSNNKSTNNSGRNGNKNSKKSCSTAKQGRNPNQFRGKSYSERGKQGTKDSDSKRVNYDNTRVSKFKRDTDNDISWYSRNPEMLKSAGSYGFSYNTGQGLEFKTAYTVPGVMALHWCPALGGKNIDAVNQASKAYYSYVVHANSRNQSYDPNDLTLVTLAGGNLFGLIANAIRAYGIAKNYSERNIYTPKALLAAIGFNPNDVIKHLSDMWFDINQLIAQMSQIWLPNDLPFVTRWFWLNTNVYTDGNSVKSQYYVFRQQFCLHYYDTNQDDSGSYLELETIPSNMTWEAYRTLLQSLIDALLNSLDRGLMYGDLLKAYGPDKIYALNEIPSDYRVIPTYNPEVLTQIENATEVTFVPAQFKQDPETNNIVEWGTQLTVNWGANYTGLMPSAHALNFHMNETPTPEQVMIATRLCTAGLYIANEAKPEGAPLLVPHYYSSGTEVICKCVVYMRKNPLQPNLQLDNFYLAYDDIYTKSVTMIRPAGTIVNDVDMYLWSAFDWAPHIEEVEPYVWSDLNPGLQDISMNNMLLDWDNYTIINPNELNKLHTAAVYSEFGVPIL